MVRRTQGHDDDADQREADVLCVVERLAPNVRRLRRAAGMTQEALCEAAGVDVSYIQRLERGVPANVTIAVLGSLARALEVDVAKLLRPARVAVRPNGRPPQSKR